MLCPLCKVSLARNEGGYRVWVCHNPECCVTMLVIDSLHPKSPWLPLAEVVFDAI